MTAPQPWPWPGTMDALLAAPDSHRVLLYEGDVLRFETPAQSPEPSGVRTSWLEPEGPHSVHNIDKRRYHAIRVELK